MTSTTNTRAGHLAKVRIDLADTNRALTAWWDGPETTGTEQTLHAALEALMRAVATLALVVEGEGS